jgi:hypothetical protein
LAEGLSINGFLITSVAMSDTQEATYRNGAINDDMGATAEQRSRSCIPIGARGRHTGGRESFRGVSILAAATQGKLLPCNG